MIQQVYKNKRASKVAVAWKAEENEEKEAEKEEEEKEYKPDSMATNSQRQKHEIRQIDRLMRIKRQLTKIWMHGNIKRHENAQDLKQREASKDMRKINDLEIKL